MVPNSAGHRQGSQLCADAQTLLRDYRHGDGSSTRPLTVLAVKIAAPTCLSYLQTVVASIRHQSHRPHSIAHVPEAYHLSVCSSRAGSNPCSSNASRADRLSALSSATSPAHACCSLIRYGELREQIIGSPGSCGVRPKTAMLPSSSGRCRCRIANVTQSIAATSARPSATYWMLDWWPPVATRSLKNTRRGVPAESSSGSS